MDVNDDLDFRNYNSYSIVGTSQYVISGANSSTRVLDISTATEPKEMAVHLSAAKVRFYLYDAQGRDFIAYYQNGDFDEPEVIGTIENQNLHSLATPDYIIVTHADFLSQAERLAQLHREYSGLTVEVVDVDQVYNEFSSGKIDVAAIRDFIKMLYDRGEDGETQLRYALLFGCGTYDNKTVGDDNPRNKIPTYQSSQSLYQVQSYVTDDFFGWMGDTEGGTDLMAKMDIAVGRIPVVESSDATAVVDKIETYLTNLDQGLWREKLVFVADDGDSNEHLSYADQLATYAEGLNPDKNITKIYLEAYASQTSSTGVTYPQANEDFANAVNNGSMLISYMGHGSATTITGQFLFNQSYISGYSNATRLPFFVLGTCDFSPFDNHGSMSIGEECLLHAGGGFIGVFASTRLVYGSSNYTLIRHIFTRLFQSKSTGENYSIGEAILYAKQQTYSLVNSIKYVYFGDPALIPADQTAYSVSTDSINGVEFEYVPQISALQKATISGSVRDDANNVVDSFNGTMDVMLYDKKNTKQTTGEISSVTSFEEYASVIYNGEVEVKNGQFDLSLTLSKDIDLEEGYGRISYFAWDDDGENASGYSNEILIGGITLPEEVDTIGPEIAYYVNYDGFASGSTSGTTQVIYATLTDQSGINTSGSGLGHDITLTIDNDRENATSLNDYFSYEKGSSTTGTLSYAISGLSEGEHTLVLKAWDNVNNSSTETFTIVVSPTSHISFGKTELYPQPLCTNSQSLKLRFSHDDGGSILTVRVSIHSIDGRRLAQEEMSTIATLTQTDEINLSDYIPSLATLPNGHYVVDVDVISSSGRSGSFAKKLTIYAQ